jgi:alpha-glucosidase (family GH31 glycosyl hydrolase)
MLRYLHKETEQMEHVEGKYVRKDQKGDYYTFPIGSYAGGDTIKYQFFCLEAGQENSTGWYEFEIFRKLDYISPNKIYYDEKSLMLQYTHSFADDLNIEFRLTDKQITVHVSHKNMSIDKKELAEDCKSWNFKQYELQVEKSPFSLSILNKDKDALIRFGGPELYPSILEDQAQSVRKVTMQYILKAEGLFGFGEKFNQVNQLGAEVKNYVYEHFTHQQEKTYLPVPFFFTDEGYGFFYETDYQVDISSKKDGDRVVLRMDAVTDTGSELDDLHIYFGEPQSMLEQYLEATGKCVLPPKWSFGPWMSANGWNTQRETLEQIEKMNQYQIPASVLVLEAWSDETTFYIFNGAKYNPKGGEDRLTYGDFSFDKDGMWPDPKEMTQILHDNNVKLVLWQVPAIKYTGDNNNQQHVNDEECVISKGYCIMDREGAPYRIPDKWFPGSLVPDFTIPEAKEWWFSKRQYLVEEVGVDGFKTDGGEFIYDNQSFFSNGKRGEAMRNPYPNLYLEGYQEFLNRYKGENQGVLFSRAGYKGAQKYPIHWAGDQMSEYVEFQAQVKAGLSAGLSGVIFWGFDLAGFAGDLPTTDLFLRSTAMAAFSPIMQFHAEPRTGQFFYEERRSWNNDRSPWNMAEVNEEPKILELYRRYANIRMNLMPYIYNEAIFCSEQGRPMLAHLILDYPEDSKVVNIEDEYMFGRSMLVAPVIQEGADGRTVYLPKGVWFDFFNGVKYEGGCEYNYSSPLGEIPVFVKEGHAIAFNLPESLKVGEFVGNDLNCYQNFVVKTFGENGSYRFKDDLGYNFTLTWSSKGRKLDGTYPESIIIL